MRLINRTTFKGFQKKYNLKFKKPPKYEWKDGVNNMAIVV